MTYLSKKLTLQMLHAYLLIYAPCTKQNEQQHDDIKVFSLSALQISLPDGLVHQFVYIF